jgi:hypothetical protein
MPLVMKMALIEEFPAMGRLFPSAMALINAAAKCAATLKSLDVHFPCAPDKRHEMGVQIGKLAANSSLTKIEYVCQYSSLDRNPTCLADGQLHALVCCAVSTTTNLAQRGQQL